ncbi:MAG: hypothetical protein KDF62_09890 [Nitrosomonas sp.]|nr:hypothetical protein [Nitrosomonas sp.]
MSVSFSHAAGSNAVELCSAEQGLCGGSALARTLRSNEERSGPGKLDTRLVKLRSYFLYDYFYK